MPSFNFATTSMSKRYREGPDDRHSKRQKLNNKGAKLMDHRYPNYTDSKSSQLSPVSPRMATKKQQLKAPSKNSLRGVQSGPHFKYESHPRHRGTKVISLVSDSDDCLDAPTAAPSKFPKSTGSASSYSPSPSPSGSSSSYCSSPESASSSHYAQDAKGYLVFAEGMLILQKYKVLRQLGKGTFSRVFDCYRVAAKKGKKYRPEKRERFAVKVIRNVYKYQVAAQTELAVLHRIRARDPDRSSCCIHIVEDSLYRGHPVLVFPLLGRSVYSFMVQSGYKPFRAEHAIDLLWQIVRGVAAIHSMDIIMTDLKPENIVLVDDAVDDAMADSHLFAAPKSTEIRLIDFGSAVIHKKGARHSHLIQTRHYRAPEAIFSMEWSFSADVWSIGCILVELVFGRMLFNTHCSIDHLNQIVKCIGGPPQRVLERVDDDVWNDFFDEKGYLDMKRATRSQTQCRALESYFDDRHCDEKCAMLFDLCRRMLCWDKDDRITAKEALKHSLFKNCRRRGK